ncbi:hypothetical protein DFH28DRAFT_495107 [Melampsora americana]|nr:hypothetical protein DFH28DRAFT_495107 [Melampsora americana]
MTNLERRKTSKPNYMTCPAGQGPPIKADVKHCTKIATHLASHRKESCGLFKSCILMTRAGLNDPRPVKTYTETEFRYYVQLMFKMACNVSRPVNFRKKPPKPSSDDFLWMTTAFPDRPFDGDQVQKCDKTLTSYMATIPLPQN